MRPTKTKPETKLCGAKGTGPCPPRNLSNAEALLRYTVQQKPPRALWGLELGNVRVCSAAVVSMATG